ncbi:MAG: XdhC family protein [Acidimicrobiales bacterium]
MAELLAERVPFVHAVVVRAQPPTSVRPGDDAVVLQSGAIEGFVGGQCTAESVQVAALGVLETGAPVLLRILPEAAATFPESPGATVVVNPCLSGGAIEIFLEPRLPSPKISVVGDTPIADALAVMAGPLGFAFSSVPTPPGDAPDDALAVIICSHGRDEPESIRWAIGGGVGYVGLVASRKRGKAVIDAMGLTAEERSRLHSPAGLDIGARTPDEIALSIMSEIVREMRVGSLAPAWRRMTAEPVQSVDPVCGMTVVVGPDTPHRLVGGAEVWFCSPGCRDRYAA